jgi:tRNA modification GTPase
MVEAAIDFPDEDIDFIADSTIVADLNYLLQQLNIINQTAKQGVLLQEGLNVVIAGAPNAGKSSLLNLLSGRDSAIVTNIPGTTRDTLREYIQIDGLPIHIIDTAGIRDTTDIVEQEGVRRAQQAIEAADLILLVEDATQQTSPVKLDEKPTIIIRNKIDLLE